MLPVRARVDAVGVAATAAATAAAAVVASLATATVAADAAASTANAFAAAAASVAAALAADAASAQGDATATDAANAAATEAAAAAKLAAVAKAVANTTAAAYASAASAAAAVSVAAATIGDSVNHCIELASKMQWAEMFTALDHMQFHVDDIDQVCRPRIAHIGSCTDDASCGRTDLMVSFAYPASLSYALATPRCSQDIRSSTMRQSMVRSQSSTSWCGEAPTSMHGCGCVYTHGHYLVSPL